MSPEAKIRTLMGRLAVTSLEELHAKPKRKTPKPKRKTLSKEMAIFESND